MIKAGFHPLIIGAVIATSAKKKDRAKGNNDSFHPLIIGAVIATMRELMKSQSLGQVSIPSLSGL